MSSITEHWMTEGVASRLGLEEYIIADSFCRVGSSHGGAAIVLRKDIKYSQIPEIKQLSVEGNIEMVAIKIKKLNLSIMSIYRPPAGDVGMFLERLGDGLDKLQNEISHKICVTGDFNIDLLGKGKNKDGLVELLKSYGLKPVFNEPSRITPRSMTCIDNIFINVDGLSYQARTFDPKLSDHSVQELKLSVNTRPDTSYSCEFLLNNSNLLKFEKSRLVSGAGYEWRKEL